MRLGNKGRDELDLTGLQSEVSWGRIRRGAGNLGKGTASFLSLRCLFISQVQLNVIVFVHITMYLYYVPC